MTLEDTEDYLEEDKPIPGQKFVCLSFISPDKLIEDKKIYTFYKFLKSTNTDYDKTFEQFKEDYFYYGEENETEIQEEFDSISDFKTSVRGVKVRGVYDNLRAANIRAKVLQKMDNSFHVFVGQVGFWLPWDPCANNIEEQEYLEEDLNKLVKEYDKNKTKKDMFYQEQKRDKKQAAIEHSLKQKELNEQERLKDLEENKRKEIESNENINESNDSIAEELSSEVNNVSINTSPKDDQTSLSSDNKVDEDLKKSLEETDPWLQRKMEESGENKN